jgi:hypothetical protein
MRLRFDGRPISHPPATQLEAPAAAARRPARASLAILKIRLFNSGTIGSPLGDDAVEDRAGITFSGMRPQSVDHHGDARRWVIVDPAQHLPALALQLQRALAAPSLPFGAILLADDGSARLPADAGGHAGHPASSQGSTRLGSGGLRRPVWCAPVRVSIVAVFPDSATNRSPSSSHNAPAWGE